MDVALRWARSRVVVAASVAFPLVYAVGGLGVAPMVEMGLPALMCVCSMWMMAAGYSRAKLRKTGARGSQAYAPADVGD